MKTLFILALLFVSFTICSSAFAYRYVNGYNRSDGTYVSGHYRDTSNDGDPSNNANTIGLNRQYRNFNS